MKGGFNSSFVEVRTFEGPKFIKDLKIGELIMNKNGFTKLEGLYKRAARFNESVYNIYCHADEEVVLDRISGEQLLYVIDSNKKTCSFTKASKLKPGMILEGRKNSYIVDCIEKLETVNRFFYNIYIGEHDFYYVEDIRIKSDIS
jgi:hypothetical protein